MMLIMCALPFDDRRAFWRSMIRKGADAEIAFMEMWAASIRISPTTLGL